MAPDGAPRKILGVIDVIAIVVGLVIGAGIFKAPSVVAANAGEPSVIILAWLLGGAVSLAGALCYAELACAYPHTGGEYHFLARAFGRPLSFLFAWSRLAVLQTGSIALLAFVLGDYVAQWLPLAINASAFYAAAAVLALTLLNIAGLRASKGLQNLLTVLTVTGLLVVVAAGLTAADTSAAPAPPAGTGSFGLAMVFVLLTYGGWNEAAYVSAEVRDGPRAMARVLVIAIFLITVLYVLANIAYLNVLGVAGVGAAEAVGADAMRAAFGDGAALLVTVLIVLAVAASINVTILTGARTNYALAQDFALFARLRRWHDGANAPVTALVVQGAIALLLVLIGAASRSGFETMVQYVSPVFWFFFLMTGVSLFVLRVREPARPRPFRVPLYPLTPLLFIAACGYMLYASLAYTGFGALFGVGVVAAGLPLLYFNLRAPMRVARAGANDRQGGM